jgi:hypothetical protein
MESQEKRRHFRFFFLIDTDSFSEKNEWGNDPTTQYPHDNGNVDDDLHVPCPPNTTERRLVNKIDWHVVPFLCIMYLLAFLDR